MSQENVERMRRSLESFDRRDKPAWIASRDPAFEVLTDNAFPEGGGAIRGREAAWNFYVEANEPFEPAEYANAEVVDAGTGKVLVHHRNHLRGKASGVGVVLEYWVVTTFRDGLAIRDQWFADRTEALQAAGLSD